MVKANTGRFSPLRLVNLAIPPPGIKFKSSGMPFVQMENISHFLRACLSPPLNLHEHDTFLTVDLYEQKDPAQVLQCLGAFSRAAHAANPSRITGVIGPRAAPSSGTGPSTPTASAGFHGRGASITSNTSSAQGSRTLLSHRTGESASGRWSPTKGHAKTPSVDRSGSPVSSWSKKEHEGATAPAWNIAQYGYMGGASQGNLGISFGGRRQIINDDPGVPSLAEKERRRKEQEAEEQEQERQRKAEAAAEEERAQQDEARRWEEETQRHRDQERKRVNEEKRRWEEEERQWKITEDKRRKEEQAADAKMEAERRRARSQSPVKLRGQYLSQYQSDRGLSGDGASDGDRIKALEAELEKARQREAEYQRERQERGHSRPRSVITEASTTSSARARSRSRPRPTGSNMSSPFVRQDSWVRGEREYLQTQWSDHQEAVKNTHSEAISESSSDAHPHVRQPEPVAEPEHEPEPVRSPRPLPDPALASPKTTSPNIASHDSGGSLRPLPDPATYHSPPTPQNRTGRFLSSNPAPTQQSPQQTYARELGGTEERDSEDRRRAQSQAHTKAGGWASKSLLEREMEMERQRQQEWEEAQRETAKAVPSGDSFDGIGGRWDVNQRSGYTGGDNQNKGSLGIGAGRRQIVGPRPLPGANR